MTNNMKPFKNACVLLACGSLLFGSFGCKTTETLLSSTQFSQSAYNTDKALKAEAVALVARAKDRAPYSGVATDVDELLMKIDQAIGTEEGRTKNGPTLAQWKKIKKQLSTFFEMWKAKESCSPAFVENASSQVSTLFDILIKTEDGKRTHS
jgi:hypothetical protein